MITKTKGLITVATGNVHYYEIAANLLMSYRYFSRNPLPFAIICEEENKYTDLFDDVIVVDEVQRSFMDKLLIMKYSPYDEALFFDADILAFGDLNEYWSFFEDATDFSTIGVWYKIGEKGAWYNLEDIGEYAHSLPYTCRVHMGVCYVRKSDSLKKLYTDCRGIEKNYSKLYFHSFPNSKDECILGIAMPMNNMKPRRENVDMLAAYPALRSINANMLKEELSYTTQWGTYSKKGLLVHWGTLQTYEPLYRFNVECLKIMCQGRKDSVNTTILYKFKIKFLFLWIEWSFYFLRKCFKKAIAKFMKMIKR